MQLLGMVAPHLFEDRKEISALPFGNGALAQGEGFV